MPASKQALQWARYLPWPNLTVRPFVAPRTSRRGSLKALRNCRRDDVVPIYDNASPDLGPAPLGYAGSASSRGNDAKPVRSTSDEVADPTPTGQRPGDPTGGVQTMADVVILGGGFGGLAAAHELRALLGDSHVITLVDRNDRFYMGFAKLWDLGGVRPLALGTRSLSRLEAHGVRFVQSAVIAIDPEQRSVTTARTTLEADALLVALGAG